MERSRDLCSRPELNIPRIRTCPIERQHQFGAQHMHYIYHRDNFLTDPDIDNHEVEEQLLLRRSAAVIAAQDDTTMKDVESFTMETDDEELHGYRVVKSIQLLCNYKTGEALSAGPSEELINKLGHDLVTITLLRTDDLLEAVDEESEIDQQHYYELEGLEDFEGTVPETLMPLTSEAAVRLIRAVNICNNPALRGQD